MISCVCVCPPTTLPTPTLTLSLFHARSLCLTASFYDSVSCATPLSTRTATPPGRRQCRRRRVAVRRARLARSNAASAPNGQQSAHLDRSTASATHARTACAVPAGQRYSGSISVAVVVVAIDVVACLFLTFRMRWLFAFSLFLSLVLSLSLSAFHFVCLSTPVPCLPSLSFPQTIDGLDGCTALRELVLDRNKIKKLEPRGFAGLQVRVCCVDAMCVCVCTCSTCNYLDCLAMCLSVCLSVFICMIASEFARAAFGGEWIAHVRRAAAAAAPAAALLVVESPGVRCRIRMSVCLLLFVSSRFDVFVRLCTCRSLHMPEFHCSLVSRISNSSS